MYFPFSYDGWYWLLIIASLVLGGLGQLFINVQYKKWSQVPLPGGITGADLARKMLQTSGVDGVGIREIPGELTDHFDPRDNSLSLSSSNFQGTSVASAAVACHEAGHAVQTARHYIPGILRTAIVPVVNFASSMWMLILLAGMVLGLTGLLYLAIILFTASVIFQLVTLPVEFNASRRAIGFIKEEGFSPEVVKGSKSVLTAAALTYVIAALLSVLQLLYYLGLANRRS